MEEDKKNDGNESAGRKRALNSYAFYSGVGFQMLAVIGVFAFIGYKIDESRDSVTPLFTAFFSLAGVFISLYIVIRSVKNNKS